MATDVLTDKPDGLGALASIDDTHGNDLIDPEEAFLRILAKKVKRSLNGQGGI